MPVILDEKYKNYPIYAQKIETHSNNPYFINGDIAVQIYLENVPNFLDVIEDGDFVVMRGGAGTNNNFHIVKLSIKDNMAYFEATSDFISDLPCKEILLEDIQEAPIYSKIIFSISNRTNQDMTIDLYGIPHQHLTNIEHINQECIDFTLNLPSERA